MSNAPTESIAIVWFKRDLRIHDHAPLSMAANLQNNNLDQKRTRSPPTPTTYQPNHENNLQFRKIFLENQEKLLVECIILRDNK